MRENKKKKSGSVRRSILIVLCVFLALILLLLLAGTIYMESMLGRINRVDKNETNSTLSASEIEDILNEGKETVAQDYTGPTMNVEDVTWAPDITEPIEQSDNIINILLIGQDRRPGETRARSDAMILCTVNKEKKTVTLTSFMRDLWVQIPGYYDERINTSYALGGMQLLNTCIEKNFGVVVDGNVEVDFSGFETVIDIVGGVDIELARSEANYLNGRHGWNLTAGVNHLNGEQALAYARNRTTVVEESGDFGRTNRQRIVLTKLMEKAKTMSLSQLNELLTEVLPTVTTDLTDAEIFGYLVELFPLLTDLKIETGRVPADGSYIMTMIDGKSVLVPDLEESRAQMKEIMAN